MTTGILAVLGNIQTDDDAAPIPGAMITLDAADLKHLADLIGQRVTITAAPEADQLGGGNG